MKPNITRRCGGAMSRGVIENITLLDSVTCILKGILEGHSNPCPMCSFVNISEGKGL